MSSNKSPLLVTAFLFTLGLSVAPWIHFSFWIVFLGATLVSFLGFCTRRFRISQIFFLLTFFLIGILRWRLASFEDPQSVAHFIPKNPVAVRLTGIVETLPMLKRRGSASFDLRCASLKENSTWRTVSGHLRVLSFDHPLPSYGEEVMVEGILKKPRGPGNPGQFDNASFLKRRGIDGILHVKPYHGLLSLGKNHASFLARRLISLKQRSLQKIDQSLPNETASLFGAMILGDRSKVEGDLWDLFTRTGTVHLLSISGLHVGIFAACIYFLFKFLRLRKEVAFSFTFFLLAAYACFVGGSPPVVRSTVMIMLYLLGNLLGREVILLNTLSSAYLLLLLWNPFHLHEAGFQLSFLSVFFLILTDEKLKPFLKKKKYPIFFSRLSKYFLELFVISLGVWAGIWPVVAYHFYLVSPVSWISNCFVIPLLFPIVALGVAWLFVFPFLPSASAALLKLEGALLSFLVWLTRGFDRIPFGSFHLFPGFLFLVFYYGVLTAFLSRNLRPFRWKMLLGILLILNLWQWSTLFKPGSQVVKATFLDVGHGDAVFLEFPEGRNLLIDGGDRRENFDAGRTVLLPYFWKTNMRRLDAVLLTHADQDHVGGIPTVLETFPPTYLFESGVSKETAAYRRYQKTLGKLSLQPVFLHRGQKIAGYPDVSLEVLNPPRPLLKGTGRDENNNGVVLKLTHGEVRMLFTADIQEDGVKNLEHSGEDLHAEVLKMPHHGGNLGREAGSFLKSVSPRIAVISVGEREEFHLPSTQTVSLLNQFHIPTYQTITSGAIQLISDGKNISVETGREGR